MPRFLNGEMKVFGGLFASERWEQRLLEILPTTIQEITREGRVFFCGYPVRDLKEFKEISLRYRASRHFSLTFLPVYDKLLQDSGLVPPFN